MGGFQFVISSVLKGREADQVNKHFDKGPFLYYVRTQGWLGGPENGNFPLLYVVKMSLRR